jgi:hypothetical protein
MADLSNVVVLGERLDDLAEALQAMRVQPGADGGARVDFAEREDSPFFRAFRRAEAELILSGDRRAWKSETRQYDAFLILVDRIANAARATTTSARRPSRDGGVHEDDDARPRGSTVRPPGVR